MKPADKRDIRRWTQNAAIRALALALPISIAATNIAAGALTAIVLVNAGRDRRSWRHALHPACLWLAGYCAAGVLACVMGVDPRLSFGALAKDFHKAWVLPVFLLAFASVPSSGVWPAFGLSFSFMACVGLFQTLTGDAGISGWLASGDLAWAWARAHGFVHPVTYGEQMVVGALGSLCLLSRPEDAGDPRSTRRWAAAALILCVGALVLSQTRAAFLGLGAGFAAVFAVDKRLRPWLKWGVAAGILIIAAWELMPTGGRSIHNYLLRMWFEWPALNRLREGRPAMWSAAARMFWDHPWFGVGPGNYRTLFGTYFHGLIDQQSIWGSAHNLYLHQLAERGLVGFSVLLGLLGAMTTAAWKRARAEPRARHLWALGTMAAFLVMNLTEVAFQNEQFATLVFFVWAWSQSGD